MRNIGTILLLFIATNTIAQPLLMPGDQAFDKRFLKDTHFEMTYAAVSGRQTVEIGSFVVNIQVAREKIAVYTRINAPSGDPLLSDTSIADIATLRPIYRSSDNSDRSYQVTYGASIDVHYYDKRSHKSSRVRENSKGAFFDSYIYPYLIGTLPLQSGYKAIFPVYDYKVDAKSNLSNTTITEVKSSMYRSDLTGEHEVWQVTIFEERTEVKYVNYIDKVSRKLWMVDILAPNGKQYQLIDKELDYNPFTVTFNKEQTYRLISAGTGTIAGKIYARDNKNSLKGIAVLNINKKQYAQRGTSVILIPYTNYFKEWVSLNEKLRKKGRSVPLSKEAVECIKVTSTYDDEGNFEFTNLMPGDYYLFTEFGYIHTASRTEVVGYTDTYINGFFQGTTANTQVFRYNTNANATVKKIVTIKKEGEKVTVRLKKTL